MGIIDTIFGGWEICEEPGWIRRPGIYGGEMRINGKHWEYKIVSVYGGRQGCETTTCYRRLRRRK